MKEKMTEIIMGNDAQKVNPVFNKEKDEKAAAKQERLARALRENLKRRKATKET